MDGVFQFAQAVHGLLIGWVFIGFLLVCLSLFIVGASFGYLLGVVLVRVRSVRSEIFKDRFGSG